MSLQRPAERVVWELRGAWGRRSKVRLTLTERCVLKTIIGNVQRVSVTGAFVVVDGWEVPIEDILAIGRPTVEEIDEYRDARKAALARLLEESSNGEAS